MYTREELALRVSIFYSSASMSGAFGGLLATGLSQISRPRSLTEAGRWVRTVHPVYNVVYCITNQILVIEGLITIVCGLRAIAIIPNSVDTASFLTPSERKHARARLETSHNVAGFSTEPERFQWLEVVRGILAPQLCSQEQPTLPYAAVYILSACSYRQLLYL